MLDSPSIRHCQKRPRTASFRSQTRRLEKRPQDLLLDSVICHCYNAGMTSSLPPLWTIDELGAQVALALSVDYEGPHNSRIREVPDRRTIRYYTTLGLIDRPAEMRGRTALYGRRHLLQLVAIKRLQARG